MKILLVTGTLAQADVRRYARESKVAHKVLALPISVAALLTPKQVAEALQKEKPSDFDIILVPGLIRGDVAEIAEELGIPTFKGPKYAADLPTVLDAVDKTQLSTIIPACEILKHELQRKALMELEEVEKHKDELLKKPGNMIIGKVAVGKDFPMRVMAEIVDAPSMSIEEVQKTAKEYVKHGADIIDIGMLAGGHRPEQAKELVKAVKESVDVPISIDTLDPCEIKAAVEGGVDMILSGDAGNLDEIAPLVDDKALVIIPTNQREGYYPENAWDRVKFLEKIIAHARKFGVEKAIADLVLAPANIFESLIAYREFARRNPETPVFVGVSNITELIDADSVGVNALLVRLASEIGASILLATEKSIKARGSIREEATASKMMFLAKKRGTVPKDLGIDLLLLKDKRNVEEPFDPGTEAKVEVVSTQEEPKHVVLDAAGSFKIMLDRINGRIVALHFAGAALTKPQRAIVGSTAAAVYTKILELKLVTRLDHAAYIGSELMKAEIALKTGKNYIQDQPLFM